MRSKWNSLTRLLVPTSALVAALGIAGTAYPGTELGNPRFVEYENNLHGISFAYPEEWNVIDLGSAVNVVGAPRVASGSRSPANGESPVDSAHGEGFGSLESVEMSFETGFMFQTPIAFERHVRKLHPTTRWKSSSFLGRDAFEADIRGRHVLMVMKDKRTVMKMSFPVDKVTGLPPALIERTVESVEFH